MSKYFVFLDPPVGHTVPPVLEEFGRWLGKQDHGSVGWFELQAEAVPVEWLPEAAPRMRRDGFVFLQMPEGSVLALLNVGAGRSAAVVLLGSEGESETIANSLEEFLHLLGQGETGLSDLDTEEALGRSKLRSWLGASKVRVPSAPTFDFNAYLDGATTAPSAAPAKPSTIVMGLLPKLAQLVALVGRRADDPELIDYVTNTLGQKLPPSTTDVGGAKNVVAKKLGVEMNFDHDILNEKYPLVVKSKTAYIPYLRLVWLSKSWAEPLPFGLGFGYTPEKLTACLGEPILRGTARIPDWQRVLDPVRDIWLSADEKSLSIKVRTARKLTSRHGVPARPVVGLFVAWALSAGLLDESAFAAHGKLLVAIRRREKPGTALVDAALSRGLWDLHLKPLPGLADFAYDWFHNIGGKYIRDDLVNVFGGREGSTGHAEPVLDDDTWDAVDEATPVLRERFAAWQ